MYPKQFLPLALAAAASAQDAMSFRDAVGSRPSDLSSLNAILIQNPDLVDTLNSARNITVLAPNNDALKAVMNSNNSDDGSMLNAPGYMQALLSYHVLNGTHHASSFGNQSMFIPTMLTNASYANVTGGQRVEAMTSGDGNVTFFSSLKQNASVVSSNLNFTGGTIHIVDNLLVIPGNATDTLPNANLTAAAGAIRDSNLTQAVMNEHDVTIFAPNNEAFNAIGSIVGNLTTEQLTNIVGYHVVNGTVDYSTMLENTTLTSMSGQDITITVVNGTVFVNDAEVTVPDILCSNGVIHVVDQVLNPDNTAASPDMTASTQTPAYTGASSDTSGIPFTSGISTATTTFPAATSAGGSGSGSDASSSSSDGLAMPKQTAAIGAAALFGGAAILANF